MCFINLGILNEAYNSWSIGFFWTQQAKDDKIESSCEMTSIWSNVFGALLFWIFVKFI